MGRQAKTTDEVVKETTDEVVLDFPKVYENNSWTGTFGEKVKFSYWIIMVHDEVIEGILKETEDFKKGLVKLK